MKKEFFSIGFVAFAIIGVLFFEAKRSINETPASGPSVADKDLYAGISSKDLQEKIRDGADLTLLDLRMPVEYSRGHIAGAINIPVADIEKHIGSFNKGNEIILYCKSGPWSRQAYRILKSNGFNNIKVLENGIVGWKWEVNGEVVTTPPSQS